MFIGYYASLSTLTWYCESLYFISKRETCNTSLDAVLVVWVKAQFSEHFSWDNKKNKSQQQKSGLGEVVFMAKLIH